MTKPPAKTLDERMAQMTTDTERELFNACCLALGALAVTPNGKQVSNMLAQMMGVVDPWAPPAPPADWKQ